MPADHVQSIEHKSAVIAVPVDIQGAAIVVGVDTLAEEKSVSGEVDTSTATSPVTILTPSAGKKIETRGVYLYTDASAGEATVRFPSSGIIVTKIYASKFARVDLAKIKFTGDVDEALVLEWSGLSTGAKIFYIVVYKEV